MKLTLAKKMVTIRWRTRPNNTAEQDFFQTINDELSKKLEAQGIQLQYDPAPVRGYVDKLSSEYSTGKAPDIVCVNGADAANFAARGAVLDLKPLVDADTSFNLADYYDAPLRELEQGGKLWGLPGDVSTLVMYYNKDLFRARGPPDPADLAAQGQWKPKWRYSPAAGSISARRIKPRSTGSSPVERRWRKLPARHVI